MVWESISSLLLFFFVVVFLVKILIPMKRFQDKTSTVINVYRIIHEIIDTAAEYGEHVKIAEVEIEYKRFHVVCPNIIDAYAELEKKCNEAIDCYQKLGELIISKNVYLREITELNRLKRVIQEEKQCFLPECETCS